MPAFVPVVDVEKSSREQASSSAFDKHKTFQNLGSIDRPADRPSNNKRGFADGSFGYGVLGNFGSNEKDDGTYVVRKNEGSQKMVKNEKGLWVKASEASEGESNSLLVTGGMGRGRGAPVLGGVKPSLGDSRLNNKEKSRNYDKHHYRSRSRSRDRDRNRDGNRDRDRDRDRDRNGDRDRDRDRDRYRGRDRSRSRERGRSRSRSRGRSNRYDEREEEDWGRHNDDRRDSYRRSRSRSRDRMRDDRRDDRRDEDKDKNRIIDPTYSNVNSSIPKDTSLTMSKEQTYLKNEDLHLDTDGLTQSVESNDIGEEFSKTFNAIQIINRFFDVFADSRISIGERLDFICELFAKDIKICSLKTGKVLISSRDELRSSFQRTQPRAACSAKRVYFEEAEAVSTGGLATLTHSFVLDCHRPFTSPGLGDGTKPGVLFYHCYGGSILGAWGMADSSDLASASLDEVKRSSAWSFCQSIIKGVCGMSTVDVHFHDYDNIEVWG